jgi:hypothetical protein
VKDDSESDDESDYDDESGESEDEDEAFDDDFIAKIQAKLAEEAKN